ncbi:Holliday junction resolvase RuvX [Buchnera aphidicola (Mollitrichosiphum nigrofasciatum)]|uniref:Holliday junction resolvase RuvX n=1 Tax=Buchnera aphidicola TaxID=9 RepID=UPI0031B830A1
MIILGFDYGTKNIGVAVGQRITKTAQSLKNISIKNNRPNWIEIENLLKEWNPKKIIVGLPLNINGSKQEITKKVENFAKIIYKKYNITVLLHDERFTTKEAKSILFQQGGFKALNKKIHSISAVLILESWLNIK